MRDEVRVSVPAKVNLHLGVGPLRGDGYHDLVTVFHAVDLRDEVTVRPAGEMRLTVRGEEVHGVPEDEGNLAWRAALLYARRRGGPSAFDITIDKRIPVAGGMAGGSADAAATLVACAALNGDRTPPDDLAAELGSDVVFPLHGGTAVGTGRGEHVRPVPARAVLHWVLAFAGFGISAGSAYRELDGLRPAPATAPPPPTGLLAALGAGDLTATAAHLHNDLQTAALNLRPELRSTLEAGTAAGSLAAVISGSGPTCAFLCEDEDATRRIAAAITPTCRATLVARGPADGARIR